MTAIISARILTLVSQGMTLEVAMDAVLGQGTFKAIAADIWTALRKEG
jgi:hypothetical protein